MNEVNQQDFTVLAKAASLEVIGEVIEKLDKKANALNKLSVDEEHDYRTPF